MPTSAEFGLGAFRHRDFACYCASRFLSALAIQMQNVAVGWLVYDLTRDPLALGLVGLAGFLPAICLALVTGHVADRFDRRAVLIVCYAVPWPRPPGPVRCMPGAAAAPVWPIYAADLRLRHRARLRQPGRPGAAAQPRAGRPLPERGRLELLGLADRHHHRPGAGRHPLRLRRHGGVRRRGRGLRGSPPCWSAADRAIAAAPAGARRPSWASLLAGILFIRSRPAILGAISLDLFAVLLGGATALLPIYARDILHGRPAGASACCAACRPRAPC